jgi:glycosyltransferase involved in cell wall biosynthesis
MKLRVLQLGPFPPPMGGVQTNLVAIHTLLGERGHTAHVINLTRFRRDDTAEVFYPHSAAQVLRLLFALRADVVHLHVGGGLPLRLLLLAVACTLLPGRRSVFTFHSGGYPESPEGKSANWWTLRGFVLRRFDRLIAVNRELADVFLRLGAKPGRVRVILPFVLPDRVSADPLPEPLAGFYAAHQPVLVSMGWLEPEYDFQLQISILSKIRQRWPAAGLAILGEGRLRPELEQARLESGAAEHVLLAGDQPHAVALQAIAGAGAFLRTTFYDGDSISVREALHLGTPVVASDNGMRPPGVVLFPARDGAALCDAIDTALAADRPTPGSSGSGRRHIEEILGMYEELVRN